MEAKIDSILEKLNKLDNHVLALQSTSTEIKEDIKKFDTRISDLEHAMSHFELDLTEVKGRVEKQTETHKQKLGQIDILKKQNTELKKRLIDLEAYGRRSSLIIDGIDETPNEDPWAKVKTEVLENIMGLKEEMKIERCHRLHGYKSTPKPIIVSLQLVCR